MEVNVLIQIVNQFVNVEVDFMDFCVNNKFNNQQIVLDNIYLVN